MITHRISQEQLMAYLDGELPIEQASLAAAHLEHCRECQSVAADLESVSRRLLEWQIDEPGPQLDARIQKALDSTSFSREMREKPRFRDRARVWPWVGAAAAAIIILMALLIPGTNKLRMIRTGDRLETKREMPAKAPKAFERAQPLYQRSVGVIGGSINGALQPAPVPPPPPQSVPSSAPAGLSIIRTAELSLTTRAFDRTRSDIERVLSAYEGYIAHLSFTNPSDQGRSLDATLKVPAAQLDSLLDALKKLGRVDAESQSAQEVTQQVVDLDAHLSNARNSEQRLTEMLRERTGKLADVLAVEEQIDNVRGQIEQMEAEQKSLSHQIAFASVDLKIAEEYKQPLAIDHSSTSTRLRNAAIKGYRSVINGAVDLLLFLLSDGPALLIIGALVFFPARALWKRKRATV